MKQERPIWNRIARQADLEGELFPGESLLELAGDGRVLIEGHRGIREYTGERICVGVSFGLVQICGCSLGICRMTKEQLVITGRIDAISILRRNRP